MKYFLIFLSLAPLSSTALFRCCGKSPKEKENDKVFFNEINKVENIIIELSKIDPSQFYPRHNVAAGCPRICKAAFRSSTNMVWTLSIDSNPENCIEIVDPTRTGPLDAAQVDYKWTIKPLTIGTATLKARYASKDDNKISDEQTITVTVIN